MLIYNYFEGFNYTETENPYAKVSFGNMGYSTNACGQNFIDWSSSDLYTEVKVNCQGTARIRRVIDSGVVDINQGGEEMRQTEFNRCFYEKPINMEKYSAMKNYDSVKV